MALLANELGARSLEGAVRISRNPARNFEAPSRLIVKSKEPP